jgi:hypothetical protein
VFASSVTVDEPEVEIYYYYKNVNQPKHLPVGQEAGNISVRVWTGSNAFIREKAMTDELACGDPFATTAGSL